MKSQANNTEKPRIQEILNLIYELASGNLVARGTVSENDDYLDGIITGINMLADEIAEDITKREQVEEELKRSKEFSETVMNGITDAVSVINVGDFTIAGVNTAFLQTYNYKEEEIIGKTCYEITHHRSVPCTAPDDVCPLDDVIISGEPAVVEHVHHSKDGRKSNVEISAFPITDEGGRTIQIVHVAKDITGRKRAEEVLKESEEKFSRAFHSNPHPMSIVTKEEGRYLDVNDSYVQTFGFSREELLGRTTVEMRILKDDSVRRKILQLQKEERALKNLEVEFYTRSGRKVDVLLSADKTEIGGQICLLSVITDITEHKQTEEALKESEENLKAYMESAPDGIYINDLKGTFLYGNEKTEALMGYKREELIGKSFLKLKLLPAKQLAKAGKLLALNAMGRSTGPDEFELTKKDGSRIWIEITTTPMKQREGVVVVGFVREITERKQAEEKRTELIQELQETLKEVRTLSGLLPICAWCKKLRDDEGYWKSVEQYIGERTKAEFTHGICPECQSKFLSEKNSNTKAS